MTARPPSLKNDLADIDKNDLLDMERAFLIKNKY
jgi:hypothetical protein